MSGLIEELTALRQRVADLEAQIEENNAQKQICTTLLNQSLQGIGVYQTGRVVFANARLAEMLGYSVEELLAATPTQHISMVHPEDRAQVIGAAEDILAGKPVPEHCETRLIHKDGTVRWLEIHMAAITYKGNPATQGSCLDITENKKMKARELALLAEEERARVLRQFIQGASHEFRTPLSMMSMNIHMVKYGLTSSAHLPYLERLTRVESLIGDITQLVDHLLLMAKLDNEAALQQRAPVNLNALLNLLDETLARKIDKTRISVICQYDTTTTYTVDADINLLYEALEKIVDNAIKYTSHGGTVTIRAAARTRHYIIEVIDCGIGIAPEILPRIFDRFFRYDTAHTTPGFGLGLPIAARIIELHQGKIEVESTPGAGSTFRIILPAIFPQQAQAPSSHCASH